MQLEGRLDSQGEDQIVRMRIRDLGEGTKGGSGSLREPSASQGKNHR